MLRSRWMAPVYALVISFLSVLLLGVVVGEPAPPATAGSSVHIRLVTTEQGRTVPVTGLEDVEVKVLVGNGQDLAVNAKGEVYDVTSGKSLTICVRLPPGWSAPRPAEPVSYYTCWPEVAPAGDGRIELLVQRRADR